MSLAEYQEKFKRLVVNKANGRLSPHKLCMLLAVLDLARAGALPENKIYFAPPLLERYARMFRAVQAPQDHPNAYFPFFHLSGRLKGGTVSFWHLQPLAGREAVVDALQTARSTRDITENIEFAYLDRPLYELLRDPDCIDLLAEVIATHWLDRGFQDLLTIAAASRATSTYERAIRTGSLSVTEAPPAPYIRDPAFRRVVTEVYDYRCAATGVRIVLPSGEAMVEAAHLHPFSAAGDDDPRNGIALNPDMHWAMDKLLIAPGPDLKWHVSPILDDRIPDYRVLAGLEGRPVILPRQPRYAPKAESLEWRLLQLRRL